MKQVNKDLIRLVASYNSEDRQKAFDLVINSKANPFETDQYGNSAFSIAVSYDGIYLAKKFVNTSRLIDSFPDLKDKTQESDEIFCWYIASNICKKNSKLVEFFELAPSSLGAHVLFSDISETCERFGLNTAELLKCNDYI